MIAIENRFNSGIIDITCLYEFAKNDKKRLSLIGKGPESKSYRKETKNLCKDIKEERGFYIWGKYDNRSALWRTIYIGKSEKLITASLLARIDKEFDTERLIFWCDPNTDASEKEENYIIEEMKRLYYKKHYLNNWSTAYKKKGTTHIIWVATPEIKNDYILDIEADLIKTMNPYANDKRPQPKPEHQNHTIAVIREMKRLIHQHRP